MIRFTFPTNNTPFGFFLLYSLCVKHDPLLLMNDFYTEEMKLADYKKPIEYVFSVEDTIMVYFSSDKIEDI